MPYFCSLFFETLDLVLNLEVWDLAVGSSQYNTLSMIVSSWSFILYNLQILQETDYGV